MTDVRTLIVDDQALVRAGFAKLLAAEPGIAVVAEAGDGEAAVALAQRHRPDVILMDIRMPVLDGLAATRRIAALGLAARVVILTTFDLDEYVFDALRAGASGFLLKDSPPDRLIEAIRVVASGEALLEPRVTGRLIAEFTRLPTPSAEVAARLRGLTPREREVLVLVGSGLSNEEIAGRLFLGTSTVKTHVGNLMAKLAARDRVQLVVEAYEGGLVRPGG